MIDASIIHLDGDGSGGNIVVLTGRAQVPGDSPADALPEYAATYAECIERNGWTPASFAQECSVPIRIELRRLRGH